MSQSFTIFDASGRGVMTLKAPNVNIAGLNVPEGGAIFSGTHDIEAVYCKGASLWPYPPRPGPWAVFDYASEVWTDPRTAADVAATARAQTETEARAYLADTDWMVIRAAEGGKPVPDDIAAKRVTARAALSP